MMQLIGPPIAMVADESRDVIEYELRSILDRESSGSGIAEQLIPEASLDPSDDLGHFV
jgi:hypothetical protein